MKTEAILTERGNTYGPFKANAIMAMAIQNTFNAVPRLAGVHVPVSQEHQYALQMIAVKLARLLTGDPNHVDSWQDIAGYAELAARQCRPTPAPPTPAPAPPTAGA